MANLETKYLGLTLRNPIIVSSSGITASLDKIKESEKNGAAAVVIKSIYEEQINFEAGHFNNKSKNSTDAAGNIQEYVSANSFEKHLTHIKEAKQAVSIPIIASINCFTENKWTDYAKQFEEAGADALELNMYVYPESRKKSSSDIEKEYYNIIKKVVKKSKIPVSVKLGYQFTNMIHVVDNIKNLGVKGVVLFNRTYEPDINIDTMELTNTAVFSSQADIRFPLRWTAILSDQVKDIDYSASTGIHDAEGVIKMVLAGADTVQVCSILYSKGLGEIRKMIDGIEEWMKQRGLDSIGSIRGLMSYRSIPDPSVYQRSQFMKYFSNFE